MLCDDLEGWDGGVGTRSKEPACQCRRCKRCRFNPWVGKIPWRRAWQPTPGFLPGESHGQISNLTANTDYEFRVKTRYENGPSSYATISFTTDMTLPYACGFENGQERWSFVDCDLEYLPSGGYSLYPMFFYTGLSSDASYEGGYAFRFAMYFSDPKPQYLISPRFTGTKATTVSFCYINGSLAQTEAFQVGYSTTTDDVNSFTWGNEITIQDMQWTRYETVFPAGTRFIAVKYTSNQNMLFLDDFRFEEYFPYAKPTNLVASVLTDQSATLTWTASDASATGYAYQYRKLGADGWSAEATVNAASVTLNGLPANTEYEFRVKALYAGGHVSNYASTRFMTEGPVERLPHIQGFENGMGGWRIVEGNIKTGISSSPDYIRTDNYGFKFYQHTATQYLMSPRLDDSSALAVEFWYKCLETDLGEGTYHLYRADFQVGYSTTTKDPTAFTWGETTLTSHGWLQYTATFPAGTRYVAIKWVDGYPFYIDDIKFTYPTYTYAEWASANGITGAWDAKDAFGIHNVFRYAFNVPTGKFENPPLISISFDASGNPVVRTPPLSPAFLGFDLSIRATDTLDGSGGTSYSLDPSGTTVIPKNSSPSRFFRLRAAEHIEIIVPTN